MGAAAPSHINISTSNNNNSQYSNQKMAPSQNSIGNEVTRKLRGADHLEHHRLKPENLQFEEQNSPVSFSLETSLNQ